MTVSVQRLPPHLIPVLNKTGKRFVTPSMHLLVSKNGSTNSSFAIVVGVKIQKSAVKRNRIKRIIREAFNQVLPSVTSPIHCLSIVKKDCSMNKTQDIIKELEVLKRP